MKQSMMLILALTAFLGCGNFNEQPNPDEHNISVVAEIRRRGTSATLFKIEADERGTTCYVLIGHKKGGVSCLRDRR